MTASAIAVALIVIAALLIFSGVAVAAPADPEVLTEPFVPTISNLQALANAIAEAEGFFVQGSVPQRAHNPGDLELGDQGLGTIGGKTIFASDDYGWQALYHQLQIIADGRSRYYNSAMTLSQFAQVYTGGDQPDAWSRNVASALGVDSTTTIGEILNA